MSQVSEQPPPDKWEISSTGNSYRIHKDESGRYSGHVAGVSFNGLKGWSEALAYVLSRLDDMVGAGELTAWSKYYAAEDRAEKLEVENKELRAKLSQAATASSQEYVTVRQALQRAVKLAEGGGNADTVKEEGEVR